MIAVSTLVSADGVVGLNGKHYILDENAELLLFKSTDKAKQFIREHGEDPDDEYLEYETISHGIMRNEDLIPALTRELHRLDDGNTYASLIDEANTIEDEIVNNPDDAEPDAASEIVNDLLDALVEQAEANMREGRIALGWCDECGEREPDDDAVMHYHAGAVISLEESGNQV